MIEIHSKHEDGSTCIRTIKEGQKVKFYGDETEIVLYVLKEKK